MNYCWQLQVEEPNHQLIFGCEPFVSWELLADRKYTNAWHIDTVAMNCTVLHCNILHCTALHCNISAVLYTALTLHCTALHCTSLHCTALDCTALHYTALHRGAAPSPFITSFTSKGSCLAKSLSSCHVPWYHHLMDTVLKKWLWWKT